MRLIPGTPIARLLDVSLLLGPLAYLFLDSTYGARGWWDAEAGALHVVVAALYGLTALRLVTLASGRLQAVFAVVMVLGIVGNAGVGQDALSVGLGGIDLFMEDGPANVFKSMGFFFPLTLLLGAVALRGRVPAWTWLTLVAAALAFPVAHVQNIAWLAIADAVAVVLALGFVFVSRRELDGDASGEAGQLGVDGAVHADLVAVAVRQGHARR
jgi:hypothetical protein